MTSYLNFKTGMVKSGTRILGPGTSGLRSPEPGTPLKVWKWDTYYGIFFTIFLILNTNTVYMKNWEMFLMEIIFQVIFFVLSRSTIFLKTLSFALYSMSHLVCLIWGRGSFLVAQGEILFQKQINSFSENERSLQFVWHTTCPPTEKSDISFLRRPIN